MTSSRSGSTRTIALIALVVVACLVPLRPADGIGTRGRMRKIAVIFKPGTVDDVPARSQQIVSENGGIDVHPLPDLQGFVAQVPEDRLGNVQSQSDVQVAAFDTQVAATATQSNPPWGLDRIDQRTGLSNSYSSTLTGTGVKVYVIDTGIRTTHTDFGGRASSGQDFVDGDTNADDCNGHGTHVAGTIGGSTYGVAKQVNLVALRVLDCNGLGFWSDVMRALEWVAERHSAGQPAVVNLSLGGGQFAPVDEAVKRLVGDRVTVVTAAGNDNDDACTTSPAAAPSALTVAASTIDDDRAQYSNFGSCVDLFAPGDVIPSDSNASNTATKTLSGTSMASAHVSGVAALFLQAHPAETPTNVTKAILQNATAGVITDSQSLHDGLLYNHFSTIPGAPQAVAARGSDGSATVSWNAPANEGGSPVTGYLVSKTPGDARPVLVDANARSLVVDGLTNGQQYTFSIKAHNAIGNGPPSTATATPNHTTHPDLVLTSVTGSPPTGKATDGIAVRFQARIQNIGSVSSPNGTVHKVQFSVDGTDVTASTSFSDGLAPGQSINVSANSGGFFGTWPARLGHHQLKGVVDSLGAIVESNEANNDLTTVFDVGANDKVGPRIAKGASNSLVVWQDSRNGNQDIYGALLDTNGNPLGPKNGFIICNLPTDQAQPTVAWNGSSYLVAWTDGRAVAGTDIFSTRVLPNGTVTNQNGVALSTAIDDQAYPVARAQGTTWLVVWQDLRNTSTGSDIYGTRVGSNGSPLGGNFAISRAERDQRRPSLAATSAGWMVVWDDRRPNTLSETADSDSDIFGARVANTGTVSDPGGIRISTAPADQSNPSISSSGSTYLVVWSDYRSKSSLDVYGARLTTAGGVLDPAGIAIAKTSKREAAPSLSALGPWLVAWEAQPNAGGNWDTMGSIVNSAGVVSHLNGTTIAGGTSDQTLPSVGVNGTNFLVAWSQSASTSTDILASRVTAGGSIVPPAGFVIAQ